MGLYAVRVTREQEATVYVQADSPEEAREDAAELVTDDGCWSTSAEDFDASEVDPGTLDPGTLVWSGGPDGMDVTAASLAGGA